MAFVPFDQTFQLTLRQQVYGQSIENVFYVKKNTGQWLQSEAETFAEDYATWVDTYLDARLSHDWIAVELYIVDMTNQNGWYFTYDLAAIGADVTDSLPTTDALCITWQTPNRGRSFRGRSYICGIPESVSTNGVMASAELPNWYNAMQEMLDVATLHSASFVVASRVQDGVTLTNGVATPITAHRVNPVFATQRRRRIGTGS